MKKLVVSAVCIAMLAIVFSCSKTVTKEPPGSSGQFQNGMKYYEKGDYLKAQKELQKVIYGFPGQTFIDTAQYYLAMTYFEIKSYPEAIGEYRKLLQTYPSSALADEAQYHVAQSYDLQSPHYWLDQTDTYSAIDEYGVFIDRYPDSPLIADANGKLALLYDKLSKKLFKSGELYLKLNDYEPALLYFGQVRDNYPNTQWASFAMYYSAVAMLKQNKKAEALTEFQNFILAFPDHKLVKKAQQQISKLTPQENGG